MNSWQSVDNIVLLDVHCLFIGVRVQSRIFCILDLVVAEELMGQTPFVSRMRTGPEQLQVRRSNAIKG